MNYQQLADRIHAIEAAVEKAHEDLTRLLVDVEKMEKAEKAAVVAPAKTVTVEDVRAALTKLASTQGPAAAKQVLGQFGVSKLTELPVAQYPAALEAAEALADD